VSHEQTSKKIQFEISELDNLISSYSNLLKMAQIKELDLIEKTALAYVLHSLYNGIENIFLVIVKAIDKKVPSNYLWHRELLDQISQKTATRPAVISSELKESLLEYLGFRHVVRHIYSTNLDAERMKNLVIHLDLVWQSFKQEIKQFLSQYSK